MFRSKLAYGVFFLAAVFFLAKPFVGFYLHSQKITKYSLAVKIFSIRKPEFLDEAKKKKTELAAHTNPPLKMVATIVALLNVLFLTLAVRRIYHRYKPQFYFGNTLYLLTGKLTI